MRIIDKKTGDDISAETLALQLYKDGQNIVYCDLECVAKSVKSFDPNPGHEGEYYLIDECGNHAWIDPEKYEVQE